ncbi:MAG: glutamate mutase L, partial [Candidatus Anammoxibacter sp.]
SYKLYVDGKTEEGSIKTGELRLIPIPVDATGEIEVLPKRGFDVGNGKGQPIKQEIKGGVVGTIIDARGRPIIMKNDDKTNKSLIKNWAEIFKAY